MTYGCAREDASKFITFYLRFFNHYQYQFLFNALHLNTNIIQLIYYIRDKIFESDPFVQLDERGLGVLIKTAIQMARKHNKDIHISIITDKHGNTFRFAQFILIVYYTKLFFMM